ncbi:putative serine racemase [Podospora fimiseda]|uniref:Serine racemase n=1 Tax=Podospora fimiseda TaxID=252190 RepID=A0AAN7H461_9PEZI|nr:putative serine racemase [Podospora fimiseda]
MSTEPQLTRASVEAAHSLIKPYIHETPVLTSKTVDLIASTPQLPSELLGTKWESQPPAKPILRLHFKCENFQKIGAFKARGAFHAIERLKQQSNWEEIKSKGVITHSSGNHASALALASSTSLLPSYIIMPTISSPLKISATQSHHPSLISIHFSGPTSSEREALTSKIQSLTSSTLIPPYDHPDIIAGQGTASLELLSQTTPPSSQSSILNAIITPLGGGGLLSGTALTCSTTPTKVYGSEPSFQGANDAFQAFYSPTGDRITTVKSLTIADGLRTPVGKLNWEIIYHRKLVDGIYSVTENQIKSALKLVLERMKIVVEPSAVVPLAVALYNEDFRKMVEGESGEKGWDLGIIFSGGNISVEGLAKLFGEDEKKETKE